MKFLFLFLSAALYLLYGCGNQPLFDKLATNQVTVIIKGTYESNDPRDWENDIKVPDNLEDDSIYVLTKSMVGAGEQDVAPTEFMIDIAALEINGDSFANYRKTYSAAIDDANEPLFNGEGVLYKNDDMTPNHTYTQIRMFIRKMLFNGAKEYTPASVNTWNTPTDVTDLFEEHNVSGLNFNLAQVLTYVDSLRVNFLNANRIFPLVIRIEDGFVFNEDDDEQVIEIRLVIKNFVKKYEYEFDSDGNRRLRHFYALSDWLRDVKRNEPAPTDELAGIMGGNLLAVARTYTPGKTATLIGTAAVGSYVMAVRVPTVNTAFDFSSLPARPPDTGSSTCDAPKVPRVPLSTFSSSDPNGYIEALLQYYLQNEVYKANFDAFVDCTSTSRYVADYEGAWNTYDSKRSSFKIPSFVTFVKGPGTTFTLTNVPAGQYNVYQSATGISQGALPDSFPITLGTNITVTEADFNSDVNVP